MNNLLYPAMQGNERRCHQVDFHYFQIMNLFTVEDTVPSVFSSDRSSLTDLSNIEPLYGYFRRNRRREDHRGKNEDLKIEAKI